MRRAMRRKKLKIMRPAEMAAMVTMMPSRERKVKSRSRRRVGTEKAMAIMPIMLASKVVRSGLSGREIQ